MLKIRYAPFQNINRKLLFFIILFSVFCVQGGSCEYYVTPGEPGDPDSPYTHTSGADGTVTFWELPLWVMISYISSIIVGFLISVKFFPPVIGRVKNVLDNKKRKKILEYISANPGKTIGELADEMEINRQTLRYHLSRLKGTNNIAVESKDYLTRIFPGHCEFSDIERKIITICHNPVQVRIIALIMKFPGIRNKDLKDQMDMSKSAVTWHINRLEKEGLLFIRKSGKARHYFIKSGYEEDIIKYLPEEIKESYEFSDRPVAGSGN